MAQKTNPDVLPDTLERLKDDFYKAYKGYYEWNSGKPEARSSYSIAQEWGTKFASLRERAKKLHVDIGSLTQDAAELRKTECKEVS